MARAWNQAVDMAFPRVTKPCTSCGAPDPTLGATAFVTPDEDIAECNDCGGLVTSSGRSLTPAMEGQRLRIIQLARPDLIPSGELP